MIKLEIYWDKATKKQGYSIVVDGKPVKEEIIKSTTEDKKLGILSELKRGLLNVKLFVKHEDILMIILQDKLITRWFYTYKAEKKYQKYIVLHDTVEEMGDIIVDIMDELSDIIEELDCKYRFTCLEEYSTKYKVPVGAIMEEKKYSVADAFADLQ